MRQTHCGVLVGFMWVHEARLCGVDAGPMPCNPGVAQGLEVFEVSRIGTEGRAWGNSPGGRRCEKDRVVGVGGGGVGGAEDVVVGADGGCVEIVIDR